MFAGQIPIHDLLVGIWNLQFLRTTLHSQQGTRTWMF
jgi:hypothetical protein